MVIALTSIELGRDLSEVRRARAWVTQTLLGYGWISRDQAEDAALMASELVSNTLQHTASVPTVTIESRPPGVRVAVFDDAPESPVMQPSASQPPGGNGLRIVDSWSAAWGVDPVPGGGKAVWFAVAQKGHTA